MSRASLGFLLLLTIALLTSTPEASASSAIPLNNRVFYLAPSNALSSSPPPSNGLPSVANLTKSQATFALSPIQSSATLSGPVTFSIWTTWTGNKSTSVPALLMASLSYHYPSQQVWTNSNSTPQSIPTQGPQNVTVSLSIPQGIFLIEQSSVMIGLRLVSSPKNSNITLTYGSLSYRSLVVLPLSGYETLSPANTISIFDSSNSPTSYFNLNAASGNNVVVLKLLVSSAFGFGDISRVNMTIEDPNLHPVIGRSNVTMQPTQSAPPGPYEFIASWVYKSNSTEGTYQVWVDIIDSQSNVAFSFRGPATFGLVPPGYIPIPWNLILYIGIAGAVAAGGAGLGIFYKRRRGRSYLVPFDHFNTMTGGALDGGTVVTVEGNTGSGKTLLLEQLMGEDLRNGRPCVFVSTGDFPSNVRANMKTMGIDVSGYEQNGLLTFVDGYSAEAGQESREKISIPSLGDLTTLGIRISSSFPAPSFKGGSLYFDSLTPLASKAKPESIVSFVQSIGAKVKGLAGKAFFTVGLGIDGTVQRQLEDTADCIVQMEAFEESGNRKRRLRIAKFRARKHQEGWVLFTIEDGKGIIFYSKRPKQ